MTTLNKIRGHSPCAEGWKKLLEHLGKTKADDEPLSIIEILDICGFDEALWCLRAVDGCDREIRLYAVWCARQVQRLLSDPYSLEALDVAERYANGLARDSELAVAEANADDSVDNTTCDPTSWAAGAAAQTANRTPWAAAIGAAECAAWAASVDTEDFAAEDATWDSVRAAQAAKLREMAS